MPDIIRDAEELLLIEDCSAGFLDTDCYEHEFSQFEFERMFTGLQAIIDDQDEYRRRVKRRFEKELDINLVADKYAPVLLNLVGAWNKH